MKSIFNKLTDQKLDKRTFIDGSIKTADEFLASMKNKTNLPVIILDNSNVIAFCWLNGIANRHAFSHHFFFKETWGKKTIEIGKKVIDYWFGMESGGEKVFDVLVGITPAVNKIAISFAKRLGYTLVGEVPTVGFISYIKRA